jgi:hypothetical protein
LPGILGDDGHRLEPRAPILLRGLRLQVRIRPASSRCTDSQSLEGGGVGRREKEVHGARAELAGLSRRDGRRAASCGPRQRRRASAHQQHALHPTFAPDEQQRFVFSTTEITPRDRPRQGPIELRVECHECLRKCRLRGQDDRKQGGVERDRRIVTK